MPKYVCDTEVVFSEGEKLCKGVEELNTSTTTYSSNVESDLSGWTSEDYGGKESFIQAKNEQVKSVQNDCTYVKEVGEFIQETAKSIDELEDQLSSVSI